MTTKGFSFALHTTGRKTLGITVNATGEVIVRGPHGTTDEQAIALVRRRRAWIYGQLRHLEQNAPENPVRELVNGSGFVVLGRGHRLRIVPDDAQDQPVVQHLHTGSGSWLRMRRTTAGDADAARQALIGFYARTGQGWIEQHVPSILNRNGTPEMPVRISTRMRTTWAYRHPDRGLTLHWATAQLSSNFLHELVHRALGLPSVAHKQLYEQAFRTLWLGDLTAQPPIAPSANACPACSAPLHNFHAPNCSSAVCAHTGRQRSDCGHEGPARFACNTIWTGQPPQLAACVEYGFYRRSSAEGSYEPCAADDPKAAPDYNRVYRECVWDAAEQRMVLRG